MAEDFDMEIDGEERARPLRRKTTSQRAVKRATPARRRVQQVFEDDEQTRFVHHRPRISIDATTNVPRKVNLYRRLAMTFLGATVLIVVVIIFFTFQKATITVHQTAVPVAASLSADIVDANDT